MSLKMTTQVTTTRSTLAVVGDQGDDKNADEDDDYDDEYNDEDDGKTERASTP